MNVSDKIEAIELYQMLGNLIVKHGVFTKEVKEDLEEIMRTIRNKTIIDEDDTFK